MMFKLKAFVFLIVTVVPFSADGLDGAAVMQAVEKESKESQVSFEY